MCLDSQVPRVVSDAIYGRVQGAVYDSNSQFWTVPCGQYLSISVSFGGTKYPVHPLDLVDDNFSYTSANGTTACIGAVRLSFVPSLSTELIFYSFLIVPAYHVGFQYPRAI